MSIQSEITRITGNVAASYTAAAEMGASLPSVQNSDNLAATVLSIPRGTTVDIPAYWQPELDSGVDAINEAMENAGRNKSAFLWYHDSHWTNNSKMSPVLLKYLQDNTALNRVNFGGDIVNTDTAASREDWSYLYGWRNAVRKLNNHHSVRGNHDDDIPGLDTDQAVYAILMAPEETADIVRGGDFYYYIDEPSEKTRYLYLNTSFCTAQNASGEEGQGQFVADMLAGTPDGWHIVVISHIWFLYTSTSAPTVGDVPTYCRQLLNLFDQYNSRGAGSIAIGSESVSYDFADKAGKVEFCIGGHTHVDYDFASDGGIPVVLTEGDSYHVRSGLSAKAGTIGESSVNGIIADYDNNKLSVVRIGRGESREVTLNNVAKPAYTNILDIVGYKLDTRISASSGYVEKPADSGADLTGYIPVKFGDVLRFKNIQIPQTTSVGYGNTIYTYDTNKTGNSSGAVTDFAGTGSWTAKWENGNLAELTYGGANGFCRFNAVNIDSTSVITINEPIE